MSQGRSGPVFGLGLALGLVLGLVVAAFLSSDVVEIPLLEGDDASGDAQEVIEQSYWQEVSSGKLEDSSIQGMVDYLHRSFEDRFSHYFNPEDFAAFQDSTEGHFSGIGLAVNEVPKGLEVVQVYEDSPAEAAEIEEGDLITEVEGESIAGEPAEASTAKIKGEAGTEVTITVVTPNDEPRELTVERAEVRIPAVVGRIRRQAGETIGYIQLRTFSQGVNADLRAEIERLVEKGAEGMVLDLRGNGGGLLDEAVTTASVFVEDGAIVSTEGRSQPREVYDAVGDALPERPMAVLIDGNTASASEIVASALADYGLATLVGTRTYGKGTFQEVIPLSNGGGINLTVGEYLTSEGVSLAGEGIPAQVKVADDDGRLPDEPLDRALQIVAGELQ